MSEKWEYAIEKTYPFPASEKELNTMGADGWELCGVLVIQEEGLFSKTFIYYFNKLNMQKKTDINKIFGKMPQARELLEEKENNLFSGYSEKTKEIFQNHISLESEEGYLLIKAQDVLDAIEEALNIIWYGPDEVPPAGGSKESITVLNQSQEKVMYDFLDASWYSADNPSRESHVEKWRYPAPIKK